MKREKAKVSTGWIRWELRLMWIRRRHSFLHSLSFFTVYFIFYTFSLFKILLDCIFLCLILASSSFAFFAFSTISYFIFLYLPHFSNLYYSSISFYFWTLSFNLYIHLSVQIHIIYRVHQVSCGQSICGKTFGRQNLMLSDDSGKILCYPMTMAKPYVIRWQNDAKFTKILSFYVKLLSNIVITLPLHSNVCRKYKNVCYITENSNQPSRY